MKYVKEKFNNTLVRLDGNTFENCFFKNCEMEYSGGKVPSFIGCTLEECLFKFTDQAGDTLAFLHAMYHGGFAPVVDETILNIRNRVYRTDSPHNEGKSST
ncbi:hypothetical protein IFT74_05240 [Oxalobacteraceae sp. CFBP 8755]|nr:hypothetical protein [Oxalobacteraceae sp. CFBP 8755]